MNNSCKKIVSVVWNEYINSGDKYSFKSDLSDDIVGSIGKKFFELNTNYGKSKKSFVDNNDIIVLPFTADQIKLFLLEISSGEKIDIANINNFITYYFIAGYLGFDIEELVESINIFSKYGSAKSDDLLGYIDELTTWISENNLDIDTYPIIRKFIYKLIKKYLLQKKLNIDNLFMLFQKYNDIDYLQDLIVKIICGKYYSISDIMRELKYTISYKTTLITDKYIYNNPLYVQKILDYMNLRSINIPSIKYSLENLSGIDTSFIDPIYLKNTAEDVDDSNRIRINMGDLINNKKTFILESDSNNISHIIVSYQNYISGSDSEEENNYNYNACIEINCIDIIRSEKRSDIMIHYRYDSVDSKNNCQSILLMNDMSFNFGENIDSFSIEFTKK